MNTIMIIKCQLYSMNNFPISQIVKENNNLITFSSMHKTKLLVGPLRRYFLVATFLNWI